MKALSIYLSRDIRKKLYSIFGHAGLGYYYAIIENLIKEPSHLWECGRLNKLSRKTKIQRNILEKFIKFCTQTVNSDGFPLLAESSKYIWCDKILLDALYPESGKKKNSGRKKVKPQESTEIKNAPNVNLTQKQYENLIKKYGQVFTRNAIGILNTWFAGKTRTVKKFLGKNNYAHFRSDGWLIAETDRILSQEKSSVIYTPDGNIKYHKVL